MNAIHTPIMVNIIPEMDRVMSEVFCIPVVEKLIPNLYMRIPIVIGRIKDSMSLSTLGLP